MNKVISAGCIVLLLVAVWGFRESFWSALSIKNNVGRVKTKNSTFRDNHLYLQNVDNRNVPSSTDPSAPLGLRDSKEKEDIATWKFPPYDSIAMDKLPAWLTDYIRFHRDSVTTIRARRNRTRIVLNNNATFLCWYCDNNGCGGLGDRINGIVTSFYLAASTNRTLVIKHLQAPSVASASSASSSLHHVPPLSLDQFLRPRRKQQYNHNVIVPVQQELKSSREGEKEEILLHWNVQQNQDLSYILSRPDTATIIATDVWERHAMLWEPRALGNGRNNIILHTNLNRPSSWWNVSSVGFRNYFRRFQYGDNKNVTNATKALSVNDRYLQERMYGLAFWTLFEWSDAVVDRSDEIRTYAGLAEPLNSSSIVSNTTRRRQAQQQFNHTLPPVTSSYIAIHLRTGGSARSVGVAHDNDSNNGGDDNSFESDPPRYPTSDAALNDLVKCASRLQRALQSHCQHAAPLYVYVASDNAGARQRMVHLDEDEQSSNIEAAPAANDGKFIRSGKSSYRKNSLIRFDPDLIPFHVDKSRLVPGHNKHVGNQDPSVENTESEAAGAAEQQMTEYDRHLDAWAELKILTEAVCLVRSTASGFSSVATRLRLDQQPRCVISVDECTNRSSNKGGDRDGDDGGGDEGDAVAKAVQVLSPEQCRSIVLPL